MSDIPVYLVGNFIVDDATRYREYEKGFFPLLKRHGGEFITYDDKHETLEGAAPRQGRIVMFRFPTEQQARNWWADADYQALSEHRRVGTRLEFLTLIHGLPARD
jgi:uncharacterized protein (DUF1330 family)